MTPADTRSTSGTFKLLSTVALVLLIVGGLNWALVGLLNFDLVAALFGPMSALSRIVYVVVGVAALYGVYMLATLNRRR